MFDLGLTELLVIAVIAILIVPPKDLPGLMRTIGQGVAKARRMFRDFQRELDKATRIDELDDIKKRVSDIRRQTESEFAKDLAARPTPGPLVPTAPRADDGHGAGPTDSAALGRAPTNQAVEAGSTRDGGDTVGLMNEDRAALELPAADTKT